MLEVKNRIVAGMQEWAAMERRIAELFSPEVTRTRYMEKAKLAHVRELQQFIKGSLSKEEKMMRPILTGEVNRLEKRLYPSIFVRLMVKLSRIILSKNTPTTKKLKPFVPVVSTVQLQAKESGVKKDFKKEVSKTMKLDRRKHTTLLPKKKMNGVRVKGLGH